MRARACRLRAFGGPPRPTSMTALREPPNKIDCEGPPGSQSPPAFSPSVSSPYAERDETARHRRWAWFTEALRRPERKARAESATRQWESP
jgi:hypothetical protein